MTVPTSAAESRLAALHVHRPAARRRGGRHCRRCRPTGAPARCRRAPGDLDGRDRRRRPDAGPRGVARGDVDDLAARPRRRRGRARVVRRRAGPDDPVPRRVDDQVGAGPPGRPGRPRRRADADRPGRPTTCPSSPAPATTARRVRDVLTMTTGVDWVEDHRDPDSLASRLLGCFAAGGDSRALLRRGAARRRARHPLRLLHRRLAGARLGARARHRRVLRRGARPAVGRPRLHERRRRRPRRRRASRWPAAGWPPPRATGRGWRCCGWPAHRRAASAARPRTGSTAAARPAYPFLGAGPAAQHASPPTPASAATGGRWTTPAAA